jgi:hypothetical protein
VTAGDREDSLRVGPMGAEMCSESRCIDIPMRGSDKDIEIFLTLAMLSGFAAAAATGAFGGMVLAGSKQAPFPSKLANTVLVIALIAMIAMLGRLLAEKANISWAGFVAMGGVIVGFVGLKAVSPFLTARAALPPGTVQPHPQYGSQPYQQGNPYANQSQPMQPYANQSQPYGAPYQQQPQHGSQPHQMQPQPQYGSQPYQQPMQQPQQYGSQPQHMPQPPQHQQVPSCPRCGTQLQFVAQYQRWFCPREQQYM